MQSCAFAFLDAGLAILLIVHCIKVGIARIEHFIVVLCLELWLGVVAFEAGHAISLALSVQRLVILFLPALRVLILILNILAVHSLLRATLQHFLEALQLLNVALDSELLHVLLEVLLNHCFGVRGRERHLHEVIAIVSRTWTA